jgi:transcriptional regulator with XRE-family HTH domain
MEIGVGRRLRELRERSGASQREIARRSGQSPGTISAIELDKVSPSVETLKRLLDCLDVSLADFFSLDPGEPSSAFFGPEQMLDVSLGPIHYRQLGRGMKQANMRFMRVTAYPGSDTGSVSNPAEVEEVGFILSGRIEATIGTETRVLTPGDGYMAKGAQLQRFRNPFDDKCEYIFVCSPPGFYGAVGLTARPI